MPSMKKTIAKALLNNRILGSGYITDTTVSHPNLASSCTDITITIQMCSIDNFNLISPVSSQKVILIKVDDE